MFGTTKPTASLSSGLLARKGQARPAMRPQGFHGHAMNLEDLGWDDMGEPFETAGPVPAAVPPIANVPPVLIERELLREEIAALPESPLQALPAPIPVSIATAARIRREVSASKAKSAFTLRLDSDRHLRLRLATATRNRSAQALVTEALDALLMSLPEVEELARQLPPPRTARSSGEKR